MHEAKLSKAPESAQAQETRGKRDDLDQRTRALPIAVRGSAPPRGAVQATLERNRASTALHNLRGLAIAFVLMVHSSLAYVASVQAEPFAFDRPPYGWLAFPILDERRWLGFDGFCAWQDVYLMSLLFFVSGVFTWPSLERDGGLRFAGKRILRLGAPLLFGVVALMPVALYPVYLVTAADPSLAAYARAYLALPFAPIGPLWFLWLLLAFALAVAALRHFARQAILRIGELSRRFERRPAAIFAAWILICTVAYVPLALMLTPWSWFNHGPFAVQLCRPLLYAAYYCAGLGVGTVGLGKGMLRTDGVVARKWPIWLGAAVASLALWMGLTGLTVRLGASTPWPVSAASDGSFALAGACGVVFVLALCLRFGADRRWPFLARISDNGLGIYILHYAPVVWLQYALIRAAWPAPLKFALVLIGATASCMAATSVADALTRSEGARRSLQWIRGA